MQSEALDRMMWNIFASSGGKKLGLFFCYFQWRVLQNNEIYELLNPWKVEYVFATDALIGLAITLRNLCLSVIFCFFGTLRRSSD
jgi:hypothetical protein